MRRHYYSPRLQKTLGFLLTRGDEGATRIEIRQLTGAEAVNSDIAKLRLWIEDTNQPFRIPPAKCEGPNEKGSLIYRYFAFRAIPPAQPLDELVEAAWEYMKAIPFDVLRMNAGNMFLDMERAEKARDNLNAILKRLNRM